MSLNAEPLQTCVIKKLPKNNLLSPIQSLQGKLGVYRDGDCLIKC